MKFEKSGISALVALVVIVAAVTGAFLYLKYVQTPEKIVEEGDCVVVNYIGKYASNGTVFDTSYESVAKENGIYDANRTYEPLKIFVDSSGTKSPPSGYENFSSSMIKGFMEGLIEMKEGETKTVTIPPEKGYGVKPKVGDVINLSSFVGTDYVFKIIDIKENATMPALYQDYFGNGTTTLYVLREDWHKVGETLSDMLSPYPAWKNSSVVTKLNETKMWLYITPSTEINENFTWIEVNETTGTQITFPENKSKITNMTNDTITVLISPAINDTIRVSQGFFYTPYKVEKITADKINASYTMSNGNKTYREFDRIVVINRNQTKNITQEYPASVLESIFSYIRSLDPTFNLSLNKLAGETLIFKITVEKVYKTSQES